MFQNRMSTVALDPGFGTHASRRLTLSWPKLGSCTGFVRSVSLFLPGAGQALRGDTTRGLFYFVTTAFLAAVAWAILETFDRLSGTLELLGFPVTTPFWALGGLYAAAGSLHLIAVLEGAGRAGGRHGPSCHPIVSGTASALVPGWGQLLNGDRLRAGLFIAGVWIAGAVWISLSPSATGLLNAHLSAVSDLEQLLRRPAVVWTAQSTMPGLLWALAIYDAASTAAQRR